MTELHEINVRLSDNQKKNLSNAYHKRETHWKIWTIYRLHKMSVNNKFTDFNTLPHKYKISVNLFYRYFTEFC